jgi:excisionase family DNA binding protein
LKDEPQYRQEGLDLLTVEEVARQLRVSPTTVREWLVQGRLHGFKLTPKVWRTRREDFQAFIAAAERQAAQAEGVPTLSGKGRWQKGTNGKLLAQVADLC